MALNPVGGFGALWAEKGARHTLYPFQQRLCGWSGWKGSLFYPKPPDGKRLFATPKSEVKLHRDVARSQARRKYLVAIPDLPNS